MYHTTFCPWNSLIGPMHHLKKNSVLIGFEILCIKMDPEKATEYLSRVNWKSLVEWATAEVILNRPSDPVQVRCLLSLSLSPALTSRQLSRSISTHISTLFPPSSTG